MKQTLLSVLLFGCLTMTQFGCADPVAQTEEEVEARVRKVVLRWTCRESRNEALRELRRLGEKKVFPAFEAILARPESSNQIALVFISIGEMKGDRSRFVEHAVRELAHPDGMVRDRAVELLGKIGTTNEASAIVALLSDANAPAATSAAESLSLIGGQRELLAMDIWLSGASHRDYHELRQHVRQHRDELKKRLDRESPKSNE